MTEALDYDTAPIGETMGPFAYVVPVDFNRRRLPPLSVADASSLRDADGREIAEPSLLCGQHTWVGRRRYHWAGSVHAKCEAEFLEPVHVGSRIEVSLRIGGKYERRGGRYVVFELETRNEGGALAARVRNTMLLNRAEAVAARAAAGRTGGRGPDTATAPPGVSVALTPKRLERDELIAFFQAEEAVYGPHPSFHNDRDFAMRSGLPDIIAPGRYVIGLVNGMMFRLHGAAWLRGARYSVSILNNILPGLDATVRMDLLDTGACAPRTFAISCGDALTGKALVSGTLTLAGATSGAS